ncbi:hypothetical protein SAMN04488550_1547 [Gordonia malaquae]|nr:hypothetical protein SAMN04488550_1547 [Gordonia malaquae]
MLAQGAGVSCLLGVRGVALAQGAAAASLKGGKTGHTHWSDVSDRPDLSTTRRFRPVRFAL